MTATASITATTSWTASEVTGPSKFNLQNISAMGASYHVDVAESEPVDTYAGMQLSGSTPHLVELADSEVLYVKSDGPRPAELRASFLDVPAEE